MFLYDPEDADLFVGAYAARGANGRGEPYARIYLRGSEHKGKYAHRIILERMLGRPLLRSELSDHKDRNTLDCRRANLRLATPTQNSCNKKRLANKINSKYKGVYLVHVTGNFIAFTRKGRKAFYGGTYRTEEEAAKAYDRIAKAVHGEFAGLNFP